jgi:small subunit ribosomal protein S2
MLVSEDIYIQSGIHIGSSFLASGAIKPYIQYRRKDKVYIIDINNIDQKITEIINTLLKYPLEEILIVANRYYPKIALTKFQKLFPQVNVVLGRYIPGTISNPQIKGFIEPSIILSTDPNTDKELIKEAKKMNIPILGLVDTDTKNIAMLDNYVVMNNRGKKSTALFIWLLAREAYMKTNKIKDYSEFKIPISYFEELES